VYLTAWPADWWPAIEPWLRTNPLPAIETPKL
jgi:hypothetical protein